MTPSFDVLGSSCVASAAVSLRQPVRACQGKAAPSPRRSDPRSRAAWSPRSRSPSSKEPSHAVRLLLPTLGPLGGAGRDLTRAAQRAEALGYHSAWVADRLLRPSRRARRTRPRPTGPAGVLQAVLDPVEALTFAAAHTRRITLGTSVLNMPFYNPVVLARRLATLDCSPAAGCASASARPGRPTSWKRSGPIRRRARPGPTSSSGAQGDVGPGPVEFQGQHFRVARSIVGLKPVQRAASARSTWRPTCRAALRRAASVADGWLPSSLPLAALGQMVPQLHALARQAGRDPGRLEVIYLTGAPAHQRAARRREAGRALPGARRRCAPTRAARRHRGHRGDRLERRRDARGAASPASSASAKPPADAPGARGSPHSRVAFAASHRPLRTPSSPR